LFTLGIYTLTNVVQLLAADQTNSSLVSFSRDQASCSFCTVVLYTDQRRFQKALRSADSFVTKWFIKKYM